MNYLMKIKFFKIFFILFFLNSLKFNFIEWKKITKNTKPTKSITYYAQWNKKLSTEEKKLWKYSRGNIQTGW